MRFYAIKINGGQAGSAFRATPGAWIEGAQFCSAIDTGLGFGYQNDPSAMRCMLQLTLSGERGALGFVRLWGIDMDMIDQSANLTDATLEIYGGFWPGLPLATWESSFTGLLYCGQVYSAFGNWEGSDMTLDIYLNPLGDWKKAGTSQSGGVRRIGEVSNLGWTTPPPQTSRLVARSRRVGRLESRRRKPRSVTQFDGLSNAAGEIGTAFAGFASGGWGESPANLIHDMKEGMPLDKALSQTLSTAFPQAKYVSLIKDGLKLDYHDAGAYQTVDQLMGYLKGLSKELAKDDKYEGVKLYAIKDRLVGMDGTKAFSDVYLQAWDLIGNVTWGGKDGDKFQVNFMTPMRADICPGVLVHMPDNVWQNITPSDTYGGNVYGQTGGVGSTVRDRITFQGPIWVDRVVINGDSRHPDGKSWALSVTGYPQVAIGDRTSTKVGKAFEAPKLVAPQNNRLTARRSGAGRSVG